MDDRVDSKTTSGILETYDGTEAQQTNAQGTIQKLNTGGLTLEQAAN